MKVIHSRLFIVAAALLVLVAVNVSIFGKERIKSGGERIYLELAPVDPRSLMQGDYMALRFTIASLVDTSTSGSAPLVVDERGVATIAASGVSTPLRIRYKIRHGQVWLGTNAWFFEEGSAERFAEARYGEFRLDRDTGEAVLVGMRDKDFRAL